PTRINTLRINVGVSPAAVVLPSDNGSSCAVTYDGGKSLIVCRSGYRYSICLPLYGSPAVDTLVVDIAVRPAALVLPANGFSAALITDDINIGLILYCFGYGDAIGITSDNPAPDTITVNPLSIDIIIRERAVAVVHPGDNSSSSSV